MLFSSANCCQEMLDIFNKVLHTGLGLLMSIRRVRVNTSDAPWMNDHLKSLIFKRQKAFHDGGTGSMLYKFYSCFNSRKEIVQGRICPPFTLLVYVLFLRTQHPSFLCPAKVPKRRVGAGWKAGNFYNMPRTALPADPRTCENCTYCRFITGYVVILSTPL